MRIYLRLWTRNTDSHITTPIVLQGPDDYEVSSLRVHPAYRVSEFEKENQLHVCTSAVSHPVLAQKTQSTPGGLSVGSNPGQVSTD
jgi:hypothetical protein